VLQVRGAFSEAESLIMAAAAVFSGNGAATWYGRALTALSDLRRRAAVIGDYVNTG
jgi:hypothetical protein